MDESTAAAAAADTAAAAKYKDVRAQIVAARLQLLDEMLALTESVQATPIVSQKLQELCDITA